jgi:hypothetical protein
MKMLKYKEFTEWINEAAKTSEDFNDIIEFVKKISAKIKTEGKVTQKIYIYLKDRASDSKSIIAELEKLGFNPEEITSSASTFPQTQFYINGKRILFIYKPIGGQAGTTLNSTITELVPCILFSYNYQGTNDPNEMLEFILTIKDLSKCVLSGDIKAAIKNMESFETSPLFDEKMQNAFAIFNWLKQESVKTKIDQVIWSYRAKPAGVPKNSRADLVVFGESNYGISLKAGSTKGAKFRKMSSTFYEYCDIVGSGLEQHTKDLIWNKVVHPFLSTQSRKNPEYKSIVRHINKNNYTNKGKTGKEEKMLQDLYIKIAKEDPKSVNDLYYEAQLLVREAITNSIKTNPEYFKQLLYAKLGLENVFPVRTLVAIKDTATEEISDSEDNMKAIIDETTNFNPIASPKSKKRFTIDLGTSEIKTFDFDVWCSQTLDSSIEGGVKIGLPLKFRIAMVG